MCVCVCALPDCSIVNVVVLTFCQFLLGCRAYTRAWLNVTADGVWIDDGICWIISRTTEITTTLPLTHALQELP
jgi:hypothetical protein